MTLTPRLGFEDCDFEIPRLRGLQVRSLIGFAPMADDDRFETALLTLSDGSVHSLYFSALLCHWTELSTEEAAILTSDYGDTRQVDYAARFGLAGAEIRDVRCLRDDATRLRLSLHRGVLELVEVVPLDGQSEAQITFSPR